jgi:hypothetical protein
VTPRPPRVAWILAAGRSATRFLAHYYQANYEGVVARHEPPTSRLLRVASNAHVAGVLSREALIALLRHKRRRYINPIEAELYIESNPYAWGFAGVFGEVWPEPTILHVVRDPREYVRSSLNHGTSTGLKWLANRFLPFWFPDVRKRLGLSFAPSWLGRAAGLWVLVNRTIEERARRCADYHLFRYEDLFDESHSGLRAMCSVLGLEYREEGVAHAPSQRVNPGLLSVLPRWPEWSREQCLELERICGALMPKYGYGGEAEWRERVDPPGSSR